MTAEPFNSKAAGDAPRRLFYFTAGFARAARLRRILHLAGYDLALGLPAPGDSVAVWGRSHFAWRGEKIAKWRGSQLVRVEDAFLRSVRPGRMGDAPLGLMIDSVGVHFDGSGPSQLETILATADLNDSNLLVRASAGITRLKTLNLSKYNIHQLGDACPEPGYILVIDQTKGDASLRFSGAADDVFQRMLAAAKAEHPGKRIVIKSHPETSLGLRSGHFGPDAGHIILAAPLSPWALLDSAAAVYTVSSQMGFESILAGHRPRVFGLPFYAGWGLSEDEIATPRRTRHLTAAQIFAAAMILAPTWYDPCQDRLCSFEQAVDQLEAEVRAYREDHAGYIALGMRLWKRGRLQRVFGRYTPLRFAENADAAVATAKKTGKGLLVWAGKEPVGFASKSVAFDTIRRVEDGFLRSRGLGADLVPPLSLVADDLGIYYDPSRESRLERLISCPSPDGGDARARSLIDAVLQNRLSKYNLGGAALPSLPAGHRILIPGQVEDDASIQLGAGKVCTNLGLIKAVRAANPDAVLIYKPHPDVEAGLRPGKIDPANLATLVQHVAEHSDPVALLDTVNAVWTMTSLLGFEALMRGKHVTCFGAPFYAGWGLTQDLGPVLLRRLQNPDGTPRFRPSLEGLVHATLIAYPRYYDPVSTLPCPPETALLRLQSGNIPRRSLGNRLLAKLQGRLASYAAIWR
jgi:capsular polysaccharide export protein